MVCLGRVSCHCVSKCASICTSCRASGSGTPQRSRRSCSRRCGRRLGCPAHRGLGREVHAMRRHSRMMSSKNYC
eukprot:6660281-Pyramimonas_sp.AAC.1